MAPSPRGPMPDCSVPNGTGPGFDHNRGYGNKQHRDAIGTPGPSPIHRYSFKGLRTGFYDGDRVESS